jgi:hypothetical protein
MARQRFSQLLLTLGIGAALKADAAVGAVALAASANGAARARVNA